MNNQLIITTVIQYFLIFAILFDATIAWFVLLKNPRRPVNQAYFFMITCITVWQIANYIGAYILLSDAAVSEIVPHVVVTRIAFAAAAVLLPAALYFISVFPDREHQPRRVVWFSAAAVVITLLSFSPWVVIESTTEVLRFGPAYGGYVAFMAVFIAVLFVMIILGWSAVRFTREQIQFQYLCLGLTVPMLFGLFTNLLAPFQQYLFAPHQSYHLIGLENFGPATTAFLSAVTGYSILRYRLLNMKILIQRNTLTAASSVLAGGIIFVALLVAARNFQVVVASSAVVTTIVVVLMALTMFMPVRSVVQRLMRSWCKPQILDFHKWTEEEMEFFRRSANPKQFARFLVVAMQTKMPVEQFRCVVYDHPARCFRLVYPVAEQQTFASDEPWLVALQLRPDMINAAAVHELAELTTQRESSQLTGRAVTGAQRRDLQRKLKQFGAHWLVPLEYNKQLCGVLCVGAKVDGTEFSMDDELWLRKFQQSAAVQMWNVLQLQHSVYTGLDEGLLERRAMKQKTV